MRAADRAQPDRHDVLLAPAGGGRVLVLTAASADRRPGGPRGRTTAAPPATIQRPRRLRPLGCRRGRGCGLRLAGAPSSAASRSLTALSGELRSPVGLERARPRRAPASAPRRRSCRPRPRPAHRCLRRAAARAGRAGPRSAPLAGEEAQPFVPWRPCRLRPAALRPGSGACCSSWSRPSSEMLPWSTGCPTNWITPVAFLPCCWSDCWICCRLGRRSPSRS